MKRLFLVISATLFISLLLATCVYAAVPHLIRFQGKVTDKAGAPLNGAYNITFRIYNSQTGGTLLWSETQSAVPVNNGIFTALLGNVAALDLPFDESYWLSMEVNNDGEMAPRQTVSSVGYAIHAETAERFIEEEVVPSGAIILWRGASCPEGYSRVTEMDGKFLVSSSSYNPVAGGSNTHTHGAGSYQGPNHTHTVARGAFGLNVNYAAAGAVAIQENSDAGAPLGGAAHDASTTSSGAGAITGTSGTADSRPEFATVILCEKD